MVHVIDKQWVIMVHDTNSESLWCMPLTNCESLWCVSLANSESLWCMSLTNSESLWCMSLTNSESLWCMSLTNSESLWCMSWTNSESLWCVSWVNSESLWCVSWVNSESLPCMSWTNSESLWCVSLAKVSHYGAYHWLTASWTFTHDPQTCSLTLMICGDHNSCLPLARAEPVVSAHAHLVGRVRLQVLNVELCLGGVAHSLSATQGGNECRRQTGVDILDIKVNSFTTEPAADFTAGVIKAQSHYSGSNSHIFKQLLIWHHFNFNSKTNKKKANPYKFSCSLWQ